MSDGDGVPFAQQLFEVLYDGTGFREAFACIGSSFQASRVSLFEDFAGTLSFDNTYEWCVPGVEPQKPFRQDLPYSLEERHFDADGLFFCSDASLSSDANPMSYGPSVVSVAQCAFFEKGVRAGFLSLEFQKAVAWDEQKRKSLIFATHAIVTFLHKDHAVSDIKSPLTFRESISLIADTLDYGFTIFSIGKDHWFHLVAANEPFFRFFGITRRQFGEDPNGILGRSVSPEDEERIRGMFASVLDGRQKKGDVVFSLKRSDGTTIILDKKVSLVPMSGSSDSLLVSSIMDITEQKKMEGRIASEQLRNQIILDQTNTAIFEWNHQSGEVYCSGSFGKYSIGTVTPKRILTVEDAKPYVHGEDADLFFHFCEEASQSVSKTECVVRFKMVDGGYRWGRFVVVQIFDGTLRMKTVGAILDIDDDKEKDIMHQELLNAVPGGIAIFKFSPDINVLYYNEGMLKLGGWPKEYVDEDIRSGKLIRNGIYASDYEKYRNDLVGRARKGEPINTTFRYYDNKRSMHWIHLAAEKIREENGFPVYYGVFTKPSEEATLYREIIESTEDNIVLIEKKDGRIIFANRCFRTLTGMERRCVEGMDFASLLGIGKNELETIAKGDTFIEDTLVQTDDGKRYLMTGKQLVWNSVPAILLYLRDETENEKQLSDLQTLLDRVPGGVGIFRIVGGKISLTFLNDEYYRLLHTTREAWKKNEGKNFLDALVPEDRAYLAGIMQSFVGNETHEDCTFRVLDGFGRPTWIRMNADSYGEKDGSKTVYCDFSNVDEQMEREIELKTSKTLADISLRNSKTSAWEFCPESGRAILTEECQRQTGLPPILEGVPESIIKSGFVHPDFVVAFRELFACVFPDHKPVQKDIMNRTGEGTGYRWFRYIIAPIYGDTGKLGRVIGTIIDISESKRLDEQYKKLLHDLDVSNEPTLIAKGRYNLSNTQIEYYKETDSDAVPFREITSYDEGLHATAATFVSDIKRTEFIRNFDRGNMLRKFKDGINEFICEYRRRRKDGSVFWANTTCRTFAEPETGSVMCFVFTHDISEQKTSQEIIDTVISTDYDYLALLDCKTSDYTVYAEDSAHAPLPPFHTSSYMDEVSSYAKKYLLPEYVDENIHDMSIGNIKERLAHQEFFTTYFSMRDEQGRVMRKKMRFSFLDRENERVLISRSDITDIYTKEQQQIQELKAARDAAEVANKAKTEFLARMSHDLRTPLNVIIGLTALAFDDIDNPKEMEKSLTDISSSGKYLLSLVNDCLDLEKIISGKMELHPTPAPYYDFYNTMKTTIGPLCKEKGITFVINDKLEDLPTVIVDTVRRDQIFYNLLSNAVKFTPKGGKVEMLTEGLVEKDGNLSCVAIVRDNGIGMSVEFQKHMYEAFTQESNTITPQYKGSGLGLPIVKQLVDLMGASITCTSVRGKGTEFRVTFTDLPIASGTFIEEKPLVAGTSGQVLRGRRILLAEDHPLNRSIAVRILEKGGMTVTTAENGREAVDKYNAATSGFFDAVLMDIRMPVMNGLDASMAIRATGKKDAKTIPIIAMTANAFLSDVEESEAAGMNAHLAKPVEPGQLYATLEEFVSKRKGADGSGNL